MNDQWISKLAEINKRTGVAPGEPIPAKNILQAFKAAGVSEEDQARILSGFMETVDVKPGDADSAPVPAPAPATLTIAEIVQMFLDPSKHADLVSKWKSLTPEQQAEISKQINSMKPEASKKAEPAPSASASAQSVPVGARISTTKGSFTRTAQGWVDTKTNKPAVGAWPGYLTRQYQAVMKRRGLTESKNPYHVKLRIGKKSPK